ncbi:MAG: ion channel [Nocardioidaceae bacterium]
MADIAPPARPERPLVRMLFGTTQVLVLLTVGYYMLPLRLAGEGPVGIVRAFASLLAFALLGWVFRLHLRWSRRTQHRVYLRIQWLLSVLYLLVLTFALVYVIVATRHPASFVGVDDRTAALYFSVTVMATVGFGDVHAADTLGQVLVTIQMVFNLVYLGTALRLLSTMRPDLNLDR